MTTDWLDLLAVQGTLKSLLQHHSSKASVLWCSAFFMVQLSHAYLTIGKTIVLTRQNYVSKVMSLLFNMLSRLVIAFLPRSKHIFNFMATVTICSDFAVAAAKSLQSCPTLCNPKDGSPLGSSVSGILQARILEWVAISFSMAVILEPLKIKLATVSTVSLSICHKVMGPDAMILVF